MTKTIFHVSACCSYERDLKTIETYTFEEFNSYTVYLVQSDFVSKHKDEFDGITNSEVCFRISSVEVIHE